MKRSVQISSLILGSAIGLIGTAYYYLVKRPQQPRRGNISLKGLRDKVEVIWDDWGIPHIYAQNETDLFFAQGFIHAQERLWQMDFNRRISAGQLAEILGQVALPLDRWMRILGFRRISEREVELLEPHTLQAMEAYTAGVNARISMGRFPLEFNLLRYRPTQWTVIDSLIWSKMMAWRLSANWEAEILRAHLINRLGAEQASLYEPFLQDELAIIPDFSKIRASALDRVNEARKILGSSEGYGSNNWAIGGNRTTTGRPILANDMHLGLEIPSIWYENHLVGGAYNLSGVSFPGFPGIIAGHNGHVAWGFTNGFPDVQDLHIEHLRETADGKIQYEYQNEWFDAEIRKEEIRIRNAPPVFEEVIATRHGPIINRLAPDFCGEAPLALQWTAFEPGEIANSFFSMFRARNCQEFKEALRRFDVPPQNTVYADIDGNIAYTLAGKIPIRAKGNGRVPIPGWTNEYEWKGYIPFDELPHLFNPPHGYIVTANNRVVQGDYPYWLGSDYISSNRAQRIRELLEANSRVDLSYVAGMQQDQMSLAAKKIINAIQDVSSEDPSLNLILERLKKWDGKLGADSLEASIYEVLILFMLKKMLSPILGDLTEKYIGKGPVPVLSELSIFGERAREWLLHTLRERDSYWFKVHPAQSKDTIVIEALRSAVSYLKQRFGPDIEKWHWGKIHKLTFRHVLGEIRPLSRALNRGPYSIGGDFDTIWATGASYHDLDKDHVTSAPFRFIADLSNLDHSLGCLVPGQSGLPGSPHYADQIQDWFSGRYHPMLYSRASVNKHRKSVLYLRPQET